jgi:hypothetical protein
LVRDDGMRNFCAAVNDRSDPAIYWALLRIGDEAIPVTGLPDVPDRWRALLVVGDPLVTQIASVETRKHRTTDRGRVRETETRAVLPLGSSDGVHEDMRFYLGRRGSWAYVERVEEHSCVVLVDFWGEKTARNLKAGDDAATCATVSHR